MTAQEEMMKKMTEADGFLAALDQSGGSTPKALKLYGIPDDAYEPGEKSMYDVVHEMRTRIITSEVFNGDRILGAILFEDTMDRDIDGIPTAQYLWEKKHIVPFLKVDKGLEDEENGVQLMKVISGLTDTCKRAKDLGVFGTKMRSVIKSANEKGITDIVNQQFDFAKEILNTGLIPIIEPEIDIHAEDKSRCEVILKHQLMKQLDMLDDNDKVIFKLTLPDVDNIYEDLIKHPKCLRVLALSGGYSRDEANERLSKQKGMIASFSRALTEGLAHDLSKEDFDKYMDESIASIFKASKAG